MMSGGKAAGGHVAGAGLPWVQACVHARAPVLRGRACVRLCVHDNVHMRTHMLASGIQTKQGWLLAQDWITLALACPATTRESRTQAAGLASAQHQVQLAGRSSSALACRTCCARKCGPGPVITGDLVVPTLPLAHGAWRRWDARSGSAFQTGSAAEYSQRALARGGVHTRQRRLVDASTH